MPTIEVDESDQVFVVKGRSASGGYHELGPDDLLVVVQQVPRVVVQTEDPLGDALGAPEVVPYARVYVGGTQIPVIDRLVISFEPVSVEFEFSGDWSTPHTERLVSRLGSYVTIRPKGFAPVPAGAVEDPYTGPRVSRYERDPVI